MFRTSFDPDTKIWSGPKVVPIYSSKVTLGQILLTSMARCPAQVGQICHDDGSKMTNSEISINSIRASLNLRNLGLKQGDVIGIVAKNSKYLAPVVIGAFLNATPINTLDPTFDSSDISHMFAITEPKLMICDLDNVETVKKSLDIVGNSADIFVFGDEKSEFKSVADLLKPHPDEEFYVPIEIENGAELPAVIICSSGTTGASKGVALSHSALAYQCLNAWAVNSYETFLSFSSLYWLTGLATLLITTYRNIIRVITTKSFSPELMFELIQLYKVNHLLTPPSQMAMMANHEKATPLIFDSVKEYTCGGSHVAKELTDSMSKLLKNGRIFLAYGMSEIAGLASKACVKDKYSVGELVQGLELKIIDDFGNKLGINERGEICCKSAFPILGYYRNEKNTKESIIDGWMHTGDIGLIDEEGSLHIIDRKKDILKYNNFQINPSEIESLIQKMNGVVMVAVIGVPHPVHTDLRAAVIVKSKGCNLTETEVHELVKNNLSQHKWLRGGVYFFDQLPMTPSGKILKRKCKDLVVSAYNSSKDSSVGLSLNKPNYELKKSIK